MERDPSRSPGGADDQRERPGSFFDRPLWRIIVPIILVTIAVQRAVVAMLYYRSDGNAFVTTGVGLQAVVALVVAVWIFRGRPRIFSSSGDR